MMTKFELKLPKMGESVAEATLTSWLKVRWTWGWRVTRR